MVDPITAPYALARYRTADGVSLGVVVGDRIRPVTPAELGGDLNDLLGAGPAGWERVAALAGSTDGWLALADVTLTAPVAPRQVIQAGANYRAHVIELVVAGLTLTSVGSRSRA